MTTSRRYESRWQNKQAAILSKKISSIFEKQAAYFVKNLDKVIKPISTNEVLGEGVEAVVSQIPDYRKMVEELVKFKILANNKGSSFLLRSLGLEKVKAGYSFNLENTGALRAMQARERFELSQAMGSITEVTQRRIKEILYSSIEQGLGYTETAQIINSQVDAGVFSLTRGKTIAVNEIGRSYGEGNWYLVDDFTSKHPDVDVIKKWVTVGPGRNVRATHTQNESDGFIPAKQAHSGTGEMFAPSHDYNCRCFERYDIN